MKKILLIPVFVSIGVFVYAQNWIQANGIADKTVRTIISCNADTLLAGVDDEGIFISHDNGENWENFALSGETVYSLVQIGNSIVAGTEGNDFYRAETLDASWDNVLINNDLVISTLSFDHDTLFACTWGDTGPGAVYFSADTGKTWAQFGTTPPYAFIDIAFNSNGRAYVATPVGAHYADNQSSWVKSTGFGGTVRTVDYIGNDSLIYGTEEGIFLSSDNGVSGQALEGIDNGVSIHYQNDTFYATMVGFGLYYTNKIGADWLSLDFDKYVLSLLKVSGKLLAGTPEGIFFLADPPDHISDQVRSSDMEVFPNPVTDRLYIDHHDMDIDKVDIIDTSGQLVLESTGSKAVDVSSLNPGIYFYRILTLERSYAGTLIKE